MKRFFVSVALFIGLAGMAFGQADSSCSAWLAGESSEANRCVSVSTFTNIATTTTVERSVNIGAEGAKLVSIIVASTNCANCDVAIADTSCTIAAGTCSVANTATSLIYFNDALAAQTFYGTAYSQFLYVVSAIAVTPTFSSTTNERLIYVRITNNDPSSDDDVTVTLIWES